MESTAKLSKVTIDCSAVAKSDAKPYTPGAGGSVPEWEKDRCIRCGICYVYCPTGSVVRLEDGFFEADKKTCSSCGICHRECWLGVISMVEEE